MFKILMKNMFSAKKLALIVSVLSGFALFNSANATIDPTYSNLHRKCESGDVNVCIDLSEKYIDDYQDSEDTKNLISAIKVADRACRLQSTLCFKYGWTLDLANQAGVNLTEVLHGKDVHEEMIRAFQNATKSEDLETRQAAYQNLAIELDATKRHVEAVEAYLKACDLKVPEACFNIAVSYATGEGVKKNKALARIFLRKACDLELQEACDYL